MLSAEYFIQPTKHQDPDKMAHNKPSHQDLHCLLFDSRFLTVIPFSNDGQVQNLRRKSPLQKLRDERVKTSRIQGHFVQSIVSLTNSLVVKMLTVLVSKMSNSQIFLLKRNVSSFLLTCFQQKYPHSCHI